LPTSGNPYGPFCAVSRLRPAGHAAAVSRAVSLMADDRARTTCRAKGASIRPEVGAVEGDDDAGCLVAYSRRAAFSASKTAMTVATVSTRSWSCCCSCRLFLSSRRSSRSPAFAVDRGDLLGSGRCGRPSQRARPWRGSWWLGSRCLPPDGMTRFPWSRVAGQLTIQQAPEAVMPRSYPPEFRRKVLDLRSTPRPPQR